MSSGWRFVARGKKEGVEALQGFGAQRITSATKVDMGGKEKEGMALCYILVRLEEKRTLPTLWEENKAPS